MHVTGARFNGLQQDFIDQPNHRSFLGHLGQFGPVGLNVLQQLDAILNNLLLDQAADRFATHAEMGFDQLVDFCPFGQNRQHRQSRRGADLIQRVQVKRIVGGHHDGPVLASHGKQGLPENDFLGDRSQQRQVDIRLTQIDELQAHRVSQRPQGLLFDHKSQLDGRAQQVALLFAQNLQLGGVDQPLVQQDLSGFHTSTGLRGTGMEGGSNVGFQHFNNSLRQSNVDKRPKGAGIADPRQKPAVFPVRRAKRTPTCLGAGEKASSVGMRFARLTGY